MNRSTLFLAAAAIAAGVTAAIIFPNKDPAATRITLACESRLDPADIDRYADAGIPVQKLLLRDGGLAPQLRTQYPTFLVGAWKNPDGGIVYPQKLDFGEVLDPKASCTEVALGNVKDAEVRPSPFRCACSTGSNCTVGGQPAIRGVTLAAGSFSGNGCEPKSCGPERAGELSATWPEECPQK